jgi:hypothetical protein
MKWIDALWTWCNATSFHAYVAITVIGILGLAFNAIARRLTPRWIAFVAKRPRLAGALLIAKGLFPEGSAILRGAAAVVTGTLQARASGAPPVPLAIIRERVDVIVNGPPQDPPPAGGAA